MRLTLRTMLAYMDDVLEPSDAREIGQKIEESSYASSMLNRTRDVMRRLRLGAPRLSGRGMGADANTVAEYLDNTLPPEQVPEFERVCLESDVHLAEVACTHQILTLVLGEPAEVDPESRRRMYRLGRQAEPAVAPVDHDATAPPMPRPRPEVPEYLREPDAWRPRWASVAAVVFVAAALVVVVVMALGPRMDWGPLAQRDGQSAMKGDEGEPGAIDPASAPEGEPFAPDDPNHAADDRTAPGPGGTGRLEQPLAPRGDRPSDADATGDAPLAPPGAADDDAPLPDETPLPDARPVPDEAVSPGDAVSPGEAGSPDEAGLPGESLHPDERPLPGAPTDAPSETMPLEPGAEGASPRTRPRDEPFDPFERPQPPTDAPLDDVVPVGDVPIAPATPPVDAEDSADAEEGAAPNGASTLGRFTSQTDLSLRWSAADSQWMRLSPGDSLLPGDRLLALPTYNSWFALSNGLSVNLLAGTRLELAAATADAAPGIAIDSGRLRIVPLYVPHPPLHLRFGERDITLTLSTPESQVAIDVRPLMSRGVDPARQPRQLAIDLYLVNGALTWIDGISGEKHELVAPARQRLQGPPPTAAEASQPPPPWVVSGSDELSPADRIATADLVKLLPPDRPVRLSLKEQVGNRRAEVRSLVVRCLAALGDYDPLIAALSDESHRTVWIEHLDTLRGAAARGAEEADLVRASLEKLRRDESADLYRMLWGYSPEQLAAGAADQLFAWLDHPATDYRVMSWWNLREIMPEGSFAYRPEQSELRRRPAIKSWRQKYDEARAAAAAGAAR